MATHAPGLLHTRGRAIGLFLLGIAAVHGAAAVISAQALVGTDAVDRCRYHFHFFHHFPDQ